MVEIISFKSRQRIRKEDPPDGDGGLVWTCGECENETFHLHDNGEVYCASCENFMHDLRTFNPEE